MDVSNAILATLAYYDGLDPARVTPARQSHSGGDDIQAGGHPLTLFELYRYLINPQRLQPHIRSLESIELRDIYEGVEELLHREDIIQENGFYSLKGRTGLSVLRLNREKISAQKWRLCLHRAYWFQAAPWIRGMFVSGSLALGTVSVESDFDILVIVEPGRLYLARLLLSGIASLISARRTRFETVAPDKFCFNHYLTLDALTITHESLYNAQTYVHLVPMMVPPKLIGQFFAANVWMNKFVYNFSPHQQVIRRTVRLSALLKTIARCIEIIGRGIFGDICERWAKQYQQKRIARNPATHAVGGRVIYTDTELEFHPHSFERTVLDRYNETIRRLGLSLNPEPDSGLIQ